MHLDRVLMLYHNPLQQEDAVDLQQDVTVSYDIDTVTS